MRKKSTIVPIFLFIYLCVMAYIGYPQYKAGAMSSLHYFGVIIVTTAVVILIHFSLKRHERLRKERLEREASDNIENSFNNDKEQ